MSALGDPFSMGMNTHAKKTWTGGYHVVVQRTAPGKWQGSCWRTPTFSPRWDWEIEAVTVDEAFAKCWALAESAVSHERQTTG